MSGAGSKAIAAAQMTIPTRDSNRTAIPTTIR